MVTLTRLTSGFCMHFCTGDSQKVSYNENNEYRDPQSRSGNKRGSRPSLLPEQTWKCGDMHAGPVGDMFSERTSTQ